MVSSSEYQTTNGPIVRKIQHDVGMAERKESSSAYTRPAGGATSGTSSGTRDYVRIHNGSDITTGTMYGTMPTYYFSVQDFSENLEDFPEFGGGEQLRYQAPGENKRGQEPILEIGQTLLDVQTI